MNQIMSFNNFKASQLIAEAADSLAATSQAGKDVAKKKVGTDQVLIPNASLLFDGDQLKWIVNGAVVKAWKAISGLTWRNTPPGDWGKLISRLVKSPEEWSKDKNAGPIPPGKYTVGRIETRVGDKSEIGSLEALWNQFTGPASAKTDADKAFQANTLYSKIGWGNFRAPIKSQSGTETYGRGSFYVHGGSLAGSHGCIDLTDQMEDFAKFYGTWLAANKKQSIELLVNYKKPNENSLVSQLWKTAQNPTAITFDIGKI